MISARQASHEANQARILRGNRVAKANCSVYSSRRRGDSQGKAGKPNEFGKMVKLQEDLAAWLETCAARRHYRAVRDLKSVSDRRPTL